MEISLEGQRSATIASIAPTPFLYQHNLQITIMQLSLYYQLSANQMTEGYQSVS